MPKKIHHILFQDNLTCFAAKIQRGDHGVAPPPPVGDDDTKDLLMVQRMFKEGYKYIRNRDTVDGSEILLIS